MLTAARTLLSVAAAAGALVAAAPAAQAQTCLAPGKVTVRPSGAHSMKVTWRAPRRVPKRASYRVLRSGKVVGQTRKRSMTVPATAGRTFTVAVGLVGRRGEKPRCFKRLRAIVPPAPTANLAAPANLAVAALTDRSAALIWDKVKRAFAYCVLRDGAVVTQARAGRYTATLAPGRSYRFQIVAVDARGRRGRVSRPLTVTTAYRAPQAPTGLRVAAADGNTLTLGWAPARAGSAPVGAYRIFRDGRVIGQTPRTTLLIAGLAPSKQYSFQVQAVDTRGYLSPVSAPMTATSNPPAPTGGGARAYLLASTDQSFKDFQAHYQQIGRVYPTYFDCTPDGRLIGEDDPLITRWAQARTVQVLARINCQRTDALHQILTDPATRAKWLDALPALARAHDYEGLNIDFEAGLYSDRAALSSFIAELGQRLHADGRILSMAVSAKVNDSNLEHPRSGIFDYPALAGSADEIIVMAWGLHWTTSAPGPTGTNAWVAQIAGYVASLPNRDRFVMGAPMYGLDWPAGGGPTHPATALEWAGVQAILARTGATVQTDSASGEQHFAYTDAQGVAHEVWFLDAASLAVKQQLAAAKGLPTAVWRLGREDPAVWQLPGMGA